MTTPRPASADGSGTHRSAGGASQTRSKTSLDQRPSMSDTLKEGFEDMKDDLMLQIDEAQWLSKGFLFSAESRPGGARTPHWSHKNKLKCKPDPKLFMLKKTGMQSMQKRKAMELIQQKKIEHAVREAEHKKNYAEKVVKNAKRTFEEADEDGGGSLDCDELIDVVKMMREEAGNPVRSMDDKIQLQIEATEAVAKYGTLEYDIRGVEVRSITFDGFLSMLGFEPWRGMFNIPQDISMFQARMTIMAKEVFEEADEDGGGSLDGEELLGVVKSLRERMGKPITYEDGGREMRRMVREVGRAVDKYGDEEGGIQFKDFLKMIKVEPWKTIFGVAQGLKKEKRQLAASKMAEDRRHTKAFIKRLDVLRGVIARDDSPVVPKYPYATRHNTLSEEVDKYAPAGGARFGLGGQNPVKAVFVSTVPRDKGLNSFFNSSGAGEWSLPPNYYETSKARPGMADLLQRKLLVNQGNDYYKKEVAEGRHPDKSKVRNALCNRSMFASSYLRMSTKGGGGRTHSIFPALNSTV